MSSQPVLYSSLDRPLVDIPLEDQSESAWDEFQELMSLPTLTSPIVNIEPMPVTHHALLQYCQLHGRLYPAPQEWADLYSLMEDISNGHVTMPPPPPVSNLSWSTISPRTKRMCFHAHIEWFHQCDLLDSAASFLVNLQESQWVHMEK